MGKSCKNRWYVTVEDGRVADLSSGFLLSSRSQSWEGKKHSPWLLQPVYPLSHRQTRHICADTYWPVIVSQFRRTHSKSCTPRDNVPRWKPHVLSGGLRTWAWRPWRENKSFWWESVLQVLKDHLVNINIFNITGSPSWNACVQRKRHVYILYKFTVWKKKKIINPTLLWANTHIHTKPN